LFEGFANVWTPLIEARRVTDRPIRTLVAGEAIVLFRGKGGRIGALFDRCPHRGVALSLGRVGDDGLLECPFHGWRFDTLGANQLAPLNPDAKCEQLGATAVPVRQVGEMVWVYTAPGSTAPSEPVAPDGLTTSGVRRIYLEQVWACHWTRAMENMLDSQHLPFVHRRTIGRQIRRRMHDGSRMDISWEATANGGRAVAALDGEHGRGGLEFFRPNMMVLTIPIPGRHFRIHALVTPVDAATTRLTLVTSRDFLRSPIFNPLFERSNRRIANEDRAIVESSQPRETPPAAQEASVRTDLVTLQFRKYYFATLKPSRADVPARSSAPGEV
jgi:phenylpropionate dioxygenase-like ring-hydroxylating dioxygenase large terminal subunit